MSGYYSTRYSPDAGRAKVWKAIVEYLTRYTGRAVETVIDIGSGYGDFINNASARFKYAVDLNPLAATFLDDGIHFYATAASDLSCIPSSSVDIAFSSNLLEHLSDIELADAANELKRILKSGGIFITMQPNYYYAYREYFDDFTHKKAFSHASLVDFFSSNDFELIHIEKRFLPFSLKSKLPKSYFLTKLYLMSPYRPFAKQMLGVFRKKQSNNIIKDR